MRAGFSHDKVQPEQRRFESGTVEEFLEQVEKLKREFANEKYNGLVTLALAGF